VSRKPRPNPMLDALDIEIAKAEAAQRDANERAREASAVLDALRKSRAIAANAQPRRQPAKPPTKGTLVP
jgi:hypothetical protein